MISKDKIKEDIFGNLRLPVDSDLCFTSLAGAWDILEKYIHGVSNKGFTCENIQYELEVSPLDFDTATKLGEVAPMKVKENKKFDDDEWGINATWLDTETGKEEYKRIWTPGA